MKINPLAQLTLSHIKEYLREPGSVFWSFGFPILMALGLGVAFSGGKEVIHSVAVVPSNSSVDTLVTYYFFEGNTTKDTLLYKTFESKSNETNYTFHITNWNNAELLVKRGIVSSIITEENNKAVFHSDPLNPESELTTLQLSEYFKTGIITSYQGEIKPLETKGTRYIDFLIPGLLGMGIMMSVMWGVCYTLIEKRSKKLLRRMVATPMKKWHFLIAQWLSRIMITVFESVVLIVFAHYFFDITIQGSMIALIMILLAGNFCFFGFSILISSRTENIQLGNGLISLITTPMIVLSGIFFNYQSFPEWAISIIKVMPLTKLVDETRAIFNEGAGLLQAMDGILILSGAGFLCFLIGLRVYRWY